MPCSCLLASTAGATPQELNKSSTTSLRCSMLDKCNRKYPISLLKLRSGVNDLSGPTSPMSTPSYYPGCASSSHPPSTHLSVEAYPLRPNDIFPMPSATGKSPLLFDCFVSNYPSIQTATFFQEKILGAPQTLHTSSWTMHNIPSASHLDCAGSFNQIPPSIDRIPYYLGYQQAMLAAITNSVLM